MTNERLGLGLQQRMATARDYDVLDVNVFLKGEHSRDLAARRLALEADAGPTDSQPSRSSIVNELRDCCAYEQQDLLEMLAAGSQESAFVDELIDVPRSEGAATSYWINNAVAASVSPALLTEITRRDDVAYVEIARHADLESLLDAKKTSKKRASKKKKATRKNAKKKASPAPIGAMEATVSGGMRVGGAADATTVPWSVTRINAPKLWQLGIDGNGVLVAVLDTGVNYKHPDLKPRMWKGGTAFPKHGYNFADGNNDPIDVQGHGTSAASQVAGTGAAGVKTGIAPKATVMAVKVGGSERNFWDGLQFAITHDADVISMSMSWKYPWSPNYPGWRRACESVLAAGILHANSIGNQGSQLSTHPIPYNIATPGNCPPPRLHPLQSPTGGLSSVISCGATDDLDSLASYSGRGPAAWEKTPYTDYPWNLGTQNGLIKPDVCAPGPGTTSCHWQYTGSSSSASAYRPFGGTSAATPHVGGCLALLASACKQSGTPIMPARMQEALENTAVRVNGQTVDKENHYGAGRVDVYGAYNYGRTRGWW